MKIAQSAVALQSHHDALSLRQRTVSAPASGRLLPPGLAGSRPGVAVSLGERAGAPPLTYARAPARAAAAQVPAESGKAEGLEGDGKDKLPDDPRLRAIAQMVQALTGESVRIFDASELQVRVESSTASLSALAQQRDAAGVRTQTLQVDAEALQVKAEGIVRTTDGQEIRFSLELQMSRVFVQATSTELALPDGAPRKDPLIIDFAGTGAQLADLQFRFDLDADGQSENIALPTGGSGFLVLDRNGDGRINDGRELFGARTGDGFAELAALDGDHNGWIDEADPVFAQLRVWRPQQGGAELGTLAEHGVGALGLERVASPYEIRTTDNRTLGVVRSTGAYLYENGQAGVLQQVDL